MPHICVGELGQHWFRQWLVACSAPSHYWNQCWLIVNWTLWNKLLWNLNRNTKPFIHENAFENVVCKMAAILSWGRWIKPPSPLDRTFHHITVRHEVSALVLFRSHKEQGTTLAASSVKTPLNDKMSASMVALLFNLNRDMRTWVLTNPSNKARR